jgi:hypothetical protein
MYQCATANVPIPLVRRMTTLTIPKQVCAHNQEMQGRYKSNGGLGLLVVSEEFEAEPGEEAEEEGRNCECPWHKQAVMSVLGHGQLESL